jgi:hypothetical protein
MLVFMVMGKELTKHQLEEYQQGGFPAARAPTRFRQDPPFRLSRMDRKFHPLAIELIAQVVPTLH